MLPGPRKDSSLFGLAATLTLLVVLLAGCADGIRSPHDEARLAATSRSTEADSRPVPPPGAMTGTAARAPGQNFRVESHVVVDTPWTVQRPDPGMGYGSFERARAQVEHLVRQLFGAYADSAKWRNGEIEFLYRDRMELHRPDGGMPYWSVEDRPAPSHVPALSVSLETTAANGPDVSSIFAALTAAGWLEDPVYSADGPDGTMFGCVCREALCRVRAGWDGGDDSDSTYVPAPGESIEIVCVPRVPE